MNPSTRILITLFASMLVYFIALLWTIQTSSIQDSIQAWPQGWLMPDMTPRKATLTNVSDLHCFRCTELKYPQSNIQIITA